MQHQEWHGTKLLLCPEYCSTVEQIAASADACLVAKTVLNTAGTSLSDEQAATQHSLHRSHTPKRNDECMQSLHM